MNGWMDGRPWKDVEYVEGWQSFSITMFLGRRGEGVLALMRFCIFYAPWSLVTLAVIKFCEIYFFLFSFSLDKSFRGREKLLCEIIYAVFEVQDC